MRESYVEAHLGKRVRGIGGWSVKLTPASQIGLPDRIVFLPDGTTRLVETKRPVGGVLSPIQGKVHERLARLSHPVVVLSTVAEVDAWVDSL